MSSDMVPPRLFRTVTSASVNYNMDTVEYLIGQEIDRRKVAGEAAMTAWETGEFRRQLIAKLIIQGDAQAAINLRPSTTRTQLNG